MVTTATCMEIQNLYPSLEEILSHHGLKKEDLDKECLSAVRNKIAVQIIEWKMIGRFLQIPEAKLAAIDRDNRKEEERRVQLLNTWHENNGRSATCLKLITALVDQRCCDLAESFCIIIKEHNTLDTLVPTGAQGQSTHQSGYRVEVLRERFEKLCKRLLPQLVSKNIQPTAVQQSLEALIPDELKLTYDMAIQNKLQVVMKEETITELFFRLRPLFGFMDFSLLCYFISKFGSEQLQADMRIYVSDIKVFMKDTTVGDLLQQLRYEKLFSKDFTELEVCICHDPKMYTLEKLNKLRNLHCFKIKLPEVLCCLASLYKLPGSFIAVWMVPKVTVEEVRKAIHEVHPSFYQAEHVTKVILDGKLLHQSDATEMLKEQEIQQKDTNMSQRLKIKRKKSVPPTAAHKHLDKLCKKAKTLQQDYEQQRNKLDKLLARLEAKRDFIDTKRQELERLKSMQGMEIDTTLSDSITKLKRNTEQINLIEKQLQDNAKEQVKLTKQITEAEDSLKDTRQHIKKCLESFKLKQTELETERYTKLTEPRRAEVQERKYKLTEEGITRTATAVGMALGGALLGPVGLACTALLAAAIFGYDLETYRGRKKVKPEPEIKVERESPEKEHQKIKEEYEGLITICITVIEDLESLLNDCEELLKKLTTIVYHMPSQ